MDTILQDLRHAARSLRQRPVFTAVAVATLALAIGANTAIFSVVNAVLLRPLPYTDPDRLVWLWDTNPSRGVPRNPMSPVAYAAYRDQSGAFEELGASRDWLPNLTGTGEPESVIGYRFSGNFFRVLGVAPLLGRTFGPEEDRPGHERVVVLSHSLWQRRFAGDPQVIGRSITLDGEAHTVLGVMPPGFQHPPRTELWAPLALAADQATNPALRFVRVIGRLKRGLTRERANAAVEAVSGHLAQQYPATNTGWTARIDPIESRYTGDARPALLVLLGAVGFVLLIACANVSNLLLARGADRRREVAVRASLGASRGRLVAQLLTESVLLAVLGGVFGLALAAWGVDLLLGLFPTSIANVAIPRLEQIHIDVPVLAFSLVLTLATGLAFGALPALQASRVSLTETLKEGGRSGSEGRRSRRFRSTLVAAELALSLVLAMGAGLMIRSFVRLRAGDLGFDPTDVLTARLMLPDYKYVSSEKRRAFFTQVIERVRALPGVDTVGSTTFLPLSGWDGTRPVEAEGRPARSPQDRIEASIRAANPDYFRALRIPLLRGRAFTDADTESAPQVALVNEALARRLFPGGDPLGKRIDVTIRGRGTAGGPVWHEVVGVIGNVRHEGLDSDPLPELYVPYAQEPLGLVSLTVRTRPGVALGDGLRQAVWSVDKDQPVLGVMPLAQLAAESITLRRVSTVLLAFFACLSLLLAALGIYGVIAHSVAQRTHEIGIRMAVGASARQVLGLVIGQGARLAAAGLAVGFAASLALTRLLTTLLFGVSPTDPLTLASVVAFLAAVALLASAVPAWRAARVDPVIALRYE